MEQTSPIKDKLQDVIESTVDCYCDTPTSRSCNDAAAQCEDICHDEMIAILDFAKKIHCKRSANSPGEWYSEIKATHYTSKELLNLYIKQPHGNK